MAGLALGDREQMLVWRVVFYRTFPYGDIPVPIDDDGRAMALPDESPAWEMKAFLLRVLDALPV